MRFIRILELAALVKLGNTSFTKDCWKYDDNIQWVFRSDLVMISHYSRQTFNSDRVQYLIKAVMFDQWSISVLPDQGSVKLGG